MSEDTVIALLAGFVVLLILIGFLYSSGPTPPSSEDYDHDHR